MRKKRTIRAFTLMEVLVGMAIVGLLTMAVINMIVAQKRQVAKTEAADLLQEVVKRNVAEVRAKRSVFYPAVDNCRVRTYDREGNLKTSTGPFDSSDGECSPSASADPNTIRVMLSTKTCTHTPNFTNGLKLPASTQFVEIEVYGSLVDNTGAEDRAFLTLYERE